ncbi:MAG: hypothetical protein AVDCRST_MAG67-264 [uncultured Solirubrobacteraceae bacterium]|uniref:Uncharacterized protein n=1 Tax=uncultured Solirubrobacteraceae bacterium TaxID=1162706 RepID=A0A6J4RMZ9_9ACTN|nr:MAG: hypothetical protein AVDCRST_MAG67-264 [uncultured Solirubrobacteraceae bacterium]
MHVLRGLPKVRCSHNYTPAAYETYVESYALRSCAPAQPVRRAAP